MKKTLILALAIFAASLAPVQLAPVQLAPVQAAFKASTKSAEGALSNIRRQALASKVYLTNQRALLVTAPVSSTVPLAIIQHLASVIQTMTVEAATPGLAAYAREQLGDPNYDVVAEFTTMRNLMVSVLQNLTTMFPKDGGGFLLYQTFAADGSIATRTFTPAQVAPAVALIDSLIASIE